MTTAKIALASGKSDFAKPFEQLAKIFTERGKDVVVEKLPISSPEEFADYLGGPVDPEIVAVCVDGSWSALQVERSSVLPLNVSQLHVADTFLRRAGRWDPELLLDQSLHDVIIRHGKSLNLSGTAYVIGDGPSLRVAAGVCLALGYRKVYLVSEKRDQLKLQSEVLRRIYVGSEIIQLPADQLTLQTVSASMLINTVSLKSRPELASDLSYFNFMLSDGIFLDVVPEKAHESIAEEAQRAGLRRISSYEVPATGAWLLARHLGWLTDDTRQEFIAEWAGAGKLLPEI